MNYSCTQQAKHVVNIDGKYKCNSKKPFAISGKPVSHFLILIKVSTLNSKIKNGLQVCNFQLNQNTHTDQIFYRSRNLNTYSSQFVFTFKNQGFWLCASTGLLTCKYSNMAASNQRILNFLRTGLKLRVISSLPCLILNPQN